MAIMSQIITGLTPNTEYEFKVVTYGNDPDAVEKESMNTDVYTIKTAKGIPLNTNTPTVVRKTQDSIYYEWSDAGNNWAEFYEVSYRADGGTGPYTTLLIYPMGS